MKILALESSAKAASAAICAEGKLLGQYRQNTGLNHSRTLLRMAEGLLSDAGMRMEDMDMVAVAKGPGSFTGVRIGVAAAKGLAWGAEKPLCGVSSLEAMAMPLTFFEGHVLCPVMDARLSQIYNALFLAEDGRTERMCEDRAIPMETLLGEIRGDEKKYILIGDGAEMCYNAFRAECPNVMLAPEALRFQSAYGVALAAESGTPEDPDRLTPNYLRLSQAERERLEKGKNIKII